uniref:FAD:protein FMN transferase n=1 Tax=Candidatus Enterococcus willemsii TaxID=1857215 RepID=UPI00403F16B5
MKKKISVLLATVVIMMGLVACGTKEEQTDSTEVAVAEGLRQEPYAQEEFLLGTYTRIRVYDEGKEDALQPAFDRIKELGDKITINQEGSEIDEINAQAGIAPVKVSDDIYDLLKHAYAYSEESEGGYNMVIGAITQLWRIGFDDARKPSQAEIDAALPLLDYKKVSFNDDEKTVYLEEKGMIIDLGAIAKGYIADEAAKVLKEHGVTSAIVDLGGNVLVVGHSWRGEGEDWNIGVQDPNNARGTILGSIKESDKTVVTSGIYERFLEVDGVKYHHIFDTKTGYPYDNDIASVSVITEKSIDGDGLTTVIFDKGIQEGLNYIEQETPEGTDAIFVTKEGDVYVTDGIKDTFRLDENSGYKMADRSKLAQTEESK